MTAQIMPSILVLFDCGVREVIKCAIMFLRVALATMDSDAFRALLPKVRLGFVSQNSLIFSPARFLVSVDDRRCSVLPAVWCCGADNARTVRFSW